MDQINKTRYWVLQDSSAQVRTLAFLYSGCNSYLCLDGCQLFSIVSSSASYVSPNSTLSSCNDALLEPACRLAYHKKVNLTATTCKPSSNNSMAIAMLNGNVHSHVKKRGEYADYSPCNTFFHHRYAVGIHNAKLDDMKRFESKEGYHNFVSKVIIIIKNRYKTQTNPNECTLLLLLVTRQSIQSMKVLKR